MTRRRKIVARLLIFFIALGAGLWYVTRPASPESRVRWLLQEVRSNPPTAMDKVMALFRVHPGQKRSPKEVVADMVALGQPAVPALIRGLKSDDPGVRANAARALGSIGDRRAVEPLIAALKDENGNVRANSARALGDLRDPATVGPLVELLADRLDYVSATAAISLGDLGDRRAVEPLITALRTREDLSRGFMVSALGRLGDERALDVLLAALNDADLDVQVRAIEALGDMKCSKAIPALEQILKERLLGKCAKQAISDIKAAQRGTATATAPAVGGAP